MMVIRNILTILLFSTFLTSCGGERIVIEVANRGWPDGTSILAVCDSTITGRTRLYGDRARITVDRPGNYTLRVSGRGYLSARTNLFQVQQGTAGITLPAAVSRRRAGKYEFGIDLATPDPLASATSLLSSSTPPFTMLTISSRTAIDEIDRIASVSHQSLVSVMVRYDASETAGLLGSGNIGDRLDSFTLAGVDGIAVTTSAEAAEILTSLFTETHDRGLYVSVLVNTGADALPPGWDTSVESALPDEVRIAVQKPLSQRSQNPVDLIDNTLNDPALQAISGTRLMVTFSLSAHTADGTAPPHGALMQALAATGGDGIFRLRDGSLRFGHLGTSYVYDDMESVRTKLAWLDMRGSGRIGGVYLSYDGRGITPGQEELKSIAELLRSW